MYVSRRKSKEYQVGSACYVYLLAIHELKGAEMKQEFGKEGIWYLGEGDSILFLELEFLHFSTSKT